MKRFPQIFYVFIFFLIFGCKEDKNEILPTEERIFFEKKHDFEPVKNPEQSKTYHTDTAYKYEYRTGESGSYQYHYEVIGKDENGQDVSGIVDMEGKFGVGILNDKTKVQAEWISHGEIKAVDENGKMYELVVK